MSDQKSNEQFTDIDKLLENFKNDIEKNSGDSGENFNAIIMPSPIVTDETSLDTPDMLSSGDSLAVDNKSNISSDAAFSVLNSKTENQVPNENISEITPPEQSIVEESPKATEVESDAPVANSKSIKTKSGCGFMTLVKTLLILFFLGCSIFALSSGDRMTATTVSESRKNSAFIFNSSSANLLSTALDEIHNMPKLYRLEQNDNPAPIPDRNKFTKIDDPERKNYNGEKIDYYKDETIEVKCWKEKIDGLTYNFAEIKIAHPSQFKRKLVDDVISNNHLDYPLNIFQSINGVVGMTSDYCAYRKYGTVVHFGKVIRDNASKNLDLMIYDNEGNLSSMTNQEFNKSELYGSDKVLFTFAFGPMLVDDYQVNTSQRMKRYYIGQVNSRYPRAAIGQFGHDNHYLLCTADYKSRKQQGTTVTRIAQVMQEKGCRFAYNMDGGQTSTLMYNGKIFNYVAYGGQREVSDIMYFATAIPND